MYLKSLTLKGFKSFPERTRLEFGPGISVVVGPNGSGKSNITDAVLWALGEQSSLAVRGSSMQDVIFGGGPGVQARSAAEVELVLDNGDGTMDMPSAEISILRRLERSGDGEYRLGGARCRLVDVIEALSDTGLGKETHSIVSQGRIESIVTSKPRDRRLLLEEAAGLGKHRKRRRRAQSKLERTQQNVDRALDVEREARTRLRPLARHAQAAELHERLERQTLEARLELARSDRAVAKAEHLRAQGAASEVRAARVEAEGRLADVMATRAAAERGLTERADQHDTLSDRLYGARAALERLRLRAEQMRSLRATCDQRITANEAELVALQGQVDAGGGSQAKAEGERRVAGLEQQLAGVEAEHQAQASAQADALGRQHAERQRELEAVRAELDRARAQDQRVSERDSAERLGSSWQTSWSEIRRLIADGVGRALRLPPGPERERAVAQIADSAEHVARGAVEKALAQAVNARSAGNDTGDAIAALERRAAEAAEAERRIAWTIEQRRAQGPQGPLAVARAQLQGELAAERRLLEAVHGEQAERDARVGRLRRRLADDRRLVPAIERLVAALGPLADHTTAHIGTLEAELARDRGAGDELAAQLSACAAQEAEVQGQLRAIGERVTEAEVALQRSADRLAEAEAEIAELAGRLKLPAATATEQHEEPLDEDQVQALRARVLRLERRREQLGPVNPLAQIEYAEAQAHVQELSVRREDLELALRELRSVIRETDRHIRESFQETFERVSANFAEVIGEVFPGGSGRLRLVEEDPAPSPVLGNVTVAPEPATVDGSGSAAEQGLGETAIDDETDEPAAPVERLLGVEIEVTPAGKSARRLSLLSGGEKSMTALAFLFALFLAHPAPFYVLDEVEAALDDLNLERFLALLRRCADRAQFIVITHQKRTMDAANWLYGVSMGADGVSRVLSRRLGAPEPVGDSTDVPDLQAVGSL